MSWVKRQAGLLCWLAGCITLVSYLILTLPSVQWSSSIMAAMPGSAKGWQQQLLQNNQSSRQLSLMLTGLPLDTLQQAATFIQQPKATQLNWYAPGTMLQQLQQYYQQHQALLVSPLQLTQLRTAQYDALVAAAWQRLLSPAPLLDGALTQDPLLLTQQLVEQQTFSSTLQPRQNWFESTAPQAPTILLHASLLIDPFDRASAALVAANLEQQLQQAQQRWPQLNIARSGVLFHAVVAAGNASFEMQFYGGLSLLAIMLLLWFSFASFRPLLLALTVLVCASASGLAALLWFYPQPHVLALVFATTLIGIAIDYSFHGMLAANRGAAYFQRMLPSLALGLLTTVMGYLLLTFLPFTVLNQVAVFICAGLLAAYLTVRLVFQRWLPQHSMPTQPKMLAWCHALSRRYMRVNRRAALIFWLAASALITAALLSQAQFISDVRLFNQSPPQLLAQEQDVRAVSSQTWDSRFIVVLADNTQQLLQREQQQLPTLERWRDEGKLGGWQAVSQLLPSLLQQDELQQLLQHAYQSAPVQAYLAQLQLPAPAPLQQRALADALLPPMNLQLQDLDTQLASVILLRGNTLSATDQAQLAASDVYWLDPIADTNRSVAHLNAQLRLWLGIAFAIALLLLLWRRGAAAAFSIALMLLLALGGSLLLSQLLQHHLNIFNLIGALLVLALALDYGVFFTSNLPHDEVVQAVLLSASTSSLAFGLLSFSQTPAVASFGLTVFLGVALAAMLSPLLNVIAVQEFKIRGTV